MLGDEEFVSELLKLDEDLRNITTKLQGYRDGKIDISLYELAREGYYDAKVFRKAKKMLDKVKEKVCYNLKGLKTFDAHGFKDENEILCRYLNFLRSEIDVKCYESYPFIYCDKFNAQIYKDLIRELREKGTKCGFIREDEEKVSFIKALDSFTNCLHTIMLKMAENVNIAKDLEDETSGICKVVRFGDKKDETVTLCKIFAKNVLKNTDTYYPVDRNRQEGFIMGNAVSFKVGGEAIHTSKIDLDKKTFIYYDFYDERIDAVKKVLEEELGLSCDKIQDDPHLPYSYLLCKDVDFEKAKKIARFLAFLPSFDQYIKRAIYKCASKLITPCIDECIEKNRDRLIEECKKKGLYHLLEEYMRDICWRECMPTVEAEATKKVREISVEALKYVIKNEDARYEDILKILEEF